MKREKKIKRRCPHCGKTYVMGQNGVVGSCDKCAHITRDKDGYTWEATEKKQLRCDIATKTLFTVKREEAFRGQP